MLRNIFEFRTHILSIGYKTPRTLLEWKHRNPILHNKSASYPEILIQPRSPSWRLHAEAKGFNPARARAEDPHLLQKKSKEERSSKMKNINARNDDDKLEKVVWEKMISRILFYVGAPMGTGFAMMQIFSVIKEHNLWDFPIWLPFLTTFITFGASTIGIVYGTLSTSWDPKRKGSALGLEEFQKNWVDMWKEEEGDDDSSY